MTIVASVWRHCGLVWTFITQWTDSNIANVLFSVTYIRKTWPHVLSYEWNNSFVPRAGSLAGFLCCLQ